MLGESLLTLAALAGQMVVDAATSDGWEKAERGYRLPSPSGTTPSSPGA